MSRARFNADVIAQLRGRVVAHNEAGGSTKLQALKKVYAQNWRGKEPATRALRAVDRFLEDRLAKVFDPSKHERDENGRFRPKGGPVGEALAPLADRREHRALMRENRAYRAAQTDVIPETRYSVFGPTAGLLAGGALGVAAGVAPRAGRRAGDIIGRRMIGEFMAQKLGAPIGAAAGAAGGVAANLTRRMMGARPRPGAGTDGAEAGARAGAAIVRHGIGGGIATANDLLLAPASAMHRTHKAREANLSGIAKLRARLKNASTRAVTAGIVPAVAYGAVGHSAMTAAGPYLDAAFPRRVEKLAKAEIVPLHARMQDELAKASALAVGARSLGTKALNRLRGGLAAARNAASGLRAPASPQQPANVRSAIRELDRGRPNTSRLPALGGEPVKGRRILGAGMGMGIAGGAVLGGAAAGAVGAGAARVYYRDEDGKFTSKDRAVMSSAAALVGAGAGALAGAALVRGANRRFAQQVASRIAGARDKHVANAAGQAEAAVKSRADALRAKIRSEVADEVSAYKQKRISAISGFTEPEAWATKMLDDEMDKAARAALPKGVFAEWKAGKPIGANEQKIIGNLQAARDKALGDYKAQLDGIKADFTATAKARSAAKKEVEAATKAAQQAEDLITERAALRNKIERELKGATDEASLAPLYNQVRAIAPERLPELSGDGASAAQITQAMDALKDIIKADTAAKTLAEQAKEAALRGALQVEEKGKRLMQVKDDLLNATLPDVPRVRNPFYAGKEKARAYFPGVPRVADIEADAAALETKRLRERFMAVAPASVRNEIERLGREIAEMASEMKGLDEAISYLNRNAARTPGQAATRKAALAQARDQRANLEMQRELKRGLVDKISSDPLTHWEVVTTQEAAQRAEAFMTSLLQEYERRSGSRTNAAMQRAGSRIAAVLAPRWKAVQEDARSVKTAVGELLGGGVGETMTRVARRTQDAAARAKTAVLGTKRADGTYAGGATEWWTDTAKRAKAAKAVSSALGALSVVGLADKAADGSLDLNFTPLQDKGILGVLGDMRQRVRPFHYTAFDLDPKNNVLVIGATYEQTAPGGKKELIFARGQIAYGDDRKPVDIPNGTPVAEVQRLVDEFRQRGRKGGGSGGGKIQADRTGMSNDEARQLADAAKAITSSTTAKQTYGEGDDAFELRTDQTQRAQEAGIWARRLRDQNQKEGRPGSDPNRNLDGGTFYKRLNQVVNTDLTVLLGPMQLRDAILGTGAGNGVFGNAAKDTFFNAARDPGANMERVLGDLIARAPQPQNEEQARNLRRAVIGLNATLKADDQMDDGALARVFGRIQIRGQAGGGGAPAPGGAASPPFDPAPARGGEPRYIGADSKVERGTADDMETQALEIALARARRVLDGEPSEKLAANLPSILRAAYSGADEALPPERRWDFAVDQTARVFPRGRVTKADIPGPLRKALTHSLMSRMDEAPAKPDRRSYFEPVRFGGTVGAAAGATAAYTLADQFMPAPLKAAGLARRLAFRLGASAGGSVSGQAAGEAAGRKAYGAGKAPPGWKAPNRSIGEEGARLAGSWGGEIVGAAMPGSIVRRIALGTAGALAGEEGAGAAYRAAAPRLEAARRKARAHVVRADRPAARPTRPPT